MTYFKQKFDIIEDGSYSSSPPYQPVIEIRTVGCGCCGEYKELTPDLLVEAIKDAEEWLKNLKELQSKV